MAIAVNLARKQLERGEVSLGAGVRMARTVDIAKVMKSCGFDWLFIDLEHSTMSLDTAVQISVAALEVGIAPLVRVPEGELTMASRALDGGALGIVIPHVDTAEQARRIVEALKFPPMGKRSMGGNLAALEFEAVNAQSAVALNALTLVVVMLETRTAIANAEEIASIPGVDVLMVGSSDLSMEMGIFGNLTDVRLVDSFRHVIEVCARQGKWPGMGGVYEPELMLRYIGMGMQMVLSGSDLSFILSAAKQRANSLRCAVGRTG
jgi:2-keto-3-deoxy-L-rhamnonate aldolase RhmA